MLKLMRDSFQHLKWILVAIVAIFILFIFVDWGGGGPNSGSRRPGHLRRARQRRDDLAPASTNARSTTWRRTTSRCTGSR